MEVHHFTQLVNWKEIKKHGFLEPRSDPLWCFNSGDRDGEIYKRYSRTYSSRLYIVAMLPNEYKKWVEWNLDVARTRQAPVLLRIPVSDPRKTLVREHRHLSTKEYEDLFGSGANAIGLLDPRFYPEQRIKYMESTVPLAVYRGNYTLPEIWIPHKVPVGQISVERTA